MRVVGSDMRYSLGENVPGLVIFSDVYYNYF